MEEENKNTKKNSKNKKSNKINIKLKSPQKLSKKSNSKKKIKTISKSKKKVSKLNKNKKNKKNKKKLHNIETTNNNIDNTLINSNINNNGQILNVNKIEDVKPKLILVDSKVGTPHFDTTKYIKADIESKNKIISKLSIIKDKYTYELKTIYIKLQKILVDFHESPEQKNKIKMLYFILNLNKKNNNDSIIKNKSLKEEYKELLNRNNYNPIERINEFGTKIDISKSENLDMISQINELKHNQIKRRNKLKLFALDKKYNFDLNNLNNELNTLNNEKHKALIRLKNNKKIINSCIIKFNNLLNTYEEYKKENINIYNNNLNKIDKDINILKIDLSGNEQEIYEKILNNQILIFKEKYLPASKKITSQIFKKFKNNSFGVDNRNTIKNLIRVSSAKSINFANINTNISTHNKKNNLFSIRKKILNLKELPKINTKNNNLINNSITIKNNNSTKNIFINKIEKNIFEELNISKIDDMSYNELNDKKEHYNIINKKLDNSIKEAEIMYKRKINQIQEKLNENINRINSVEKKNNYIKNEINSLYKILRFQKNEFINKSNDKKFII